MLLNFLFLYLILFVISTDVYQWADSSGKMIIRVCLFFPMETWSRLLVWILFLPTADVLVFSLFLPLFMKVGFPLRSLSRRQDEHLAIGFIWVVLRHLLMDL